MGPSVVKIYISSIICVKKHHSMLVLQCDNIIVGQYISKITLLYVFTIVSQEFHFTVRLSEVNKVVKPTNLVGRKYCDSFGLTENISWKSRIIVIILMLISQSSLAFSKNSLQILYFCTFRIVCLSVIHTVILMLTSQKTFLQNFTEDIFLSRISKTYIVFQTLVRGKVRSLYYLKIFVIISAECRLLFLMICAFLSIKMF
jgi:hypothetical protein